MARTKRKPEAAIPGLPKAVRASEKERILDKPSLSANQAGKLLDRYGNEHSEAIFRETVESGPSVSRRLAIRYLAELEA